MKNSFYEKILESMNNISDSMKSVVEAVTTAVDFVGEITGFIGAILGWLGFSTIVVLLGILFIYKIINILFPTSPRINLGLALIGFTVLWVSWNVAYYKGPEFLTIGKTYGFIGLHIAVVYLLHYIISKIVEKIRGRMQSRRISKADVIELYDRIDEGVVVIKHNLKTGNKQGAKDAFDDLQKKLAGALE